MLEVDKKIIELLKNGATLSKLKTATGLYSSDLTRRIHSLENKGYLLHRKFTERGVKYIILPDPVMDLQDNIEIVLNNSFSFIVLTDTHIGNVYEDLSLAEKLYSFADSRDIRYAFHLGDLIEGPPLHGHSNDRIKRHSVHKQLDYLTANYPKYDKIDTVYIAGNHDYRAQTDNCIDISRVISNRRLDMHYLGVSNSKIRIGNRDILLSHPLNIEKEYKYDNKIKELYPDDSFDLILRGHTHHNGMYVNDAGSLVIDVPACYSSPTRPYIGAYWITIREKDLVIKNLIIGNKIDIFLETKHKLESKKLIKK